MLKLTPLDDEVQELDARDFGNLLHNVLKQFGRSGLRNSIDEKAIADYLDQQLELAANDVYGGEALFPVQIQIEQARDRLRAFAQWQAARALQGWDIIHTEHECEIELHLDDGRIAKVLGKIDRIDRHRGEKTWAILDYKTGEQAKSPRETHFRGGEWVDLQLPLYRLLAEPHGIRGDVQLGYITIPRRQRPARLPPDRMGPRRTSRSRSGRPPRGPADSEWRVLERTRPPVHVAPGVRPDLPGRGPGSGGAGMRELSRRIHHGGTEARRNPGSRGGHAVDKHRFKNTLLSRGIVFSSVPPCLRASVVNCLLQ